MPKNMNEGVDLLINEGLAGMPTADKLWLILIDEAEDDVGPTDTLATLTQSVATELSATGLACANRSIDLGGPHNWPEIVGSPAAIAILTDDPDTVGSKVIAVQDINGGVALDLSVVGPYSASALSLKVAYQDEA